MGRSILIITVVWSLVGAPMLCRAGVLVRCCADTPQEQPSADRGGCESGCCGSPSDKVPARDNDRRECGSCGALCDAVAKPIDDERLAGLLMLADHSEPAIGAVGPGFLSAVTLPMVRAAAPEHPPDIPRVPFPPSDVPLLI